MVEYQCGSNDITQSTDANVIVKPMSTSPPRLSCSSRQATCGSALVSCSSDQRLRKTATVTHAPKYSTARAMKNGTFKYTPLCCSNGSCATASGRAHSY